MIAFGPVPSRRLGFSLGINNIPHKVCSYSCVYCQVGRTRKYAVAPQRFYAPRAIAAEVRAALSRSDAKPDYLSFVPDGEPTLDAGLAESLELLRPLGCRTAVISNGSLVNRTGVAQALGRSDWVSFKVDALEESTWRRIDRPHRSLDLQAILDGQLAFRRSYGGRLATETMLVAGINDSEAAAAAIAEYLARLRPDIAYIAVPTRPPADSRVRPPPAETVNRAYQLFREKLSAVELLVGYEGSAFTATGSPEHDLLSITAVHPMRADAVRALLARSRAGWEVVAKLLDRGLLREVAYGGKLFYLRKFQSGVKCKHE
jgi:wyosine [tRNA(Phe)-imidazoG37] synthetase (radical SAM superfamily)